MLTDELLFQIISSVIKGEYVTSGKSLFFLKILPIYNQIFSNKIKNPFSQSFYPIGANPHLFLISTDIANITFAESPFSYYLNAIFYESGLIYNYLITHSQKMKQIQQYLEEYMELYYSHFYIHQFDYYLFNCIYSIRNYREIIELIKNRNTRQHSVEIASKKMRLLLKMGIPRNTYYDIFFIYKMYPDKLQGSMILLSNQEETANKILNIKSKQLIYHEIFYIYYLLARTENIEKTINKIIAKHDIYALPFLVLSSLYLLYYPSDKKYKNIITILSYVKNLLYSSFTYTEINIDIYSLIIQKTFYYLFILEKLLQEDFNIQSTPVQSIFLPLYDLIMGGEGLLYKRDGTEIEM